MGRATLFRLRGYNIKYKIIVGIVVVTFLNGCTTLKESLILGAGSGVVAGAIVGSQTKGDRGENTIKGAVIGGVLLGLISYAIHGSLEKRDANVRRETLMNLEHYEVLGFEGVSPNSSNSSSGKCFTTKEVDGRVVSIPCSLVNDEDEAQ